MRRLSLILLAAVAAFAAAAAGGWTASWLTAEPGGEVYELEGHSALRIRNSEQGVDVVFNWGVFDFNTRGFVWRFALGETDYLMAGEYMKDFRKLYDAEGRRVYDQRLRLSSEQVEGLFDELLKIQMQSYRYNYVLDNCATRPLSYLERSLDGKLTVPSASELTDATFRSEMKRYHASEPWYQLGIDLALGSLIDKPLTRLERGFAPIEMKEIISEAVVTDSAGQASQPLVVETTVIEPRSTHISQREKGWEWPSPTLVAWILAAAVAAVSARDLHCGRCSRLTDTIVFSLQGLLGLLLTFLIFVSTHYATSPNWLYLWLNPLAFIAVAGAWQKGRGAIWAAYHTIDLTAIAALAVILAAGVQGGNAAFGPLMGCSAMRSATRLAIYFKTR